MVNETTSPDFGCWSETRLSTHGRNGTTYATSRWLAVDGCRSPPVLMIAGPIGFHVDPRPWPVVAPTVHRSASARVAVTSQEAQRLSARFSSEPGTSRRGEVTRRIAVTDRVGTEESTRKTFDGGRSPALQDPTWRSVARLHAASSASHRRFRAGVEAGSRSRVTSTRYADDARLPWVTPTRPVKTRPVLGSMVVHRTCLASSAISARLTPSKARLVVSEAI